MADHVRLARSLRLATAGEHRLAQEAAMTAHRRGFASMDKDTPRAIASKGGKVAHRLGRAHEWSADEAREAGRKGGLARSRNRRHTAARTAAPTHRINAGTAPNTSHSHE